jgi:hypothetical protein
MNPRFPHGLVAAAGSAVLALLVGVQPVRAQVTNVPQPGNPSSFTNGPLQVGPAPQQQQAKLPPAALPGATPRAAPIAPAQGNQIADPNEALFDAINRGDLAAARDAVDRGADLNGRNLLGMTPLDESIDLGRNDITFFLLSLRSGPAHVAGRAQAAGPSSRAAAAALERAARKPAARPTPVAGSLARQPAVPAPAPSGPPPAQQLANTGTPNPSAGFLGFGPSR